jgi:hypothetical protein
MDTLLESGIRTVSAFEEANAVGNAGDRLDAVRLASRRFREDFMATGMPDGVRTCDLITLPYPSEFAFWHANRHPSPFIMFTNRMMIVRYRDWEGQSRILLFNPTDYDRAAEVPFYKRLAEKYGTLVSHMLLTQRHGTVTSHLKAHGIRLEDVDYLSFDHLHTQDLRGWIGPNGAFPRARLLVQEPEWRTFQRLHPLQAWWYIAQGVEGVPEERVTLLHGDVTLGSGVALLSTPGHTWGNHSLALHTPRGVTVISENGVCVDNYAPEHSRLPGLKAYAESGQEVVLNGNTLEGSLEQYISMVKEKEVAGPHPDYPAFPNHFSSSELTAHWMFPGLEPTVAQRSLSHGSL